MPAWVWIALAVLAVLVVGVLLLARVAGKQVENTLNRYDAMSEEEIAASNPKRLRRDARQLNFQVAALREHDDDARFRDRAQRLTEVLEKIRRAAPDAALAGESDAARVAPAPKR